MTDKRVNIAVCGRFHLANYVPMVRSAGYLNRFYYSHPAPIEAGDHGEYIRMPLKEYLIQGHSRLFGQALLDAFNPLYASLWAQQALARWSPSALLHFVLLGHSLPLIERARADGARVLADAVSTHPEHRRGLMSTEADSWGIKNIYGRGKPYEGRIDDELEQAHALIAPSAHVAQTYTARHPHLSTTVIPYAANTARFFPDPNPGRRAGPLRVLTVGTVGLRKGQLYVLEALSRMPRGTVELTLIGSIDSVVGERLKAYGHLFSHIPRVPNERLVEIHHSHDLFLLTSVEEGLAVSLCEAMGSGMAVACTAETGAPEVITPGWDGYILPSRSVEAIEEFLTYALLNRDALNEVGRRAAQTSKQETNWSSYAKRLMFVYDNLLSPP